ncbi:MAG: RNA polymerase sigma factor [Acidimicrobiia bacterium]|nr:RNA polymerase sigma factor [Acidimicrobiia bacterium]
MVALVELAKSGDREAFDRLVRVTHSDAYALALRLTGSTEDARDVVQEAYLRAYKGVGRFRGEAQFSTWLYRIVANCATTHLSRRQRHRHDHLGVYHDVIDTRPDHDPSLQGDRAELRERLDDAIRDLPVRLRSVVVLRDMYDLPHEAIAAELGISVTATKVRLHRARRRLREQVLPMPGEEPDRDE